MHDAAKPSYPEHDGGPVGDRQLAYTVPRAARALDISDRKAWELVHSGVIKSIKIGRSRRVTRQALEEYIETLEAAA
jgi:excisionase family DNA binding protein